MASMFHCSYSLTIGDAIRASSQYKDIYPGMGIPMLKIRRSRDCLIFNMGILILIRQHLYIGMVPWCNESLVSSSSGNKSQHLYTNN